MECHQLIPTNLQKINLLVRGVKVAQETLTLLVGVRIPANQPGL